MSDFVEHVTVSLHVDSTESDCVTSLSVLSRSLDLAISRSCSSLQAQRLDKEMRTSIHAYLCACKDEQDREIAKTRLRESTLSDVTQSDSVESTCSETVTCSTGSDTSDVSMESLIPGRPHLNTTVCAHIRI